MTDAPPASTPAGAPASDALQAVPSLLPHNASPQERAIEAATARLADVPVPLRDLWNPETCPAELLPWLAWAFGVDEWESGWTEAAKRAAIRDSVNIHRHKGTVWAIKRVLANAGHGDAQLFEGHSASGYDDTFDHDAGRSYGDPEGWAKYSFVTNRVISVADGEKIRALLAATAPARCHLQDLAFTDAVFYDDEFSYDGTYNHGAV